ncbi:MAG: 50S ribosomal protein L25, partial [Maribacter sp.]
GNSPGVRNGGRLLFRKRKLAIKALPSKLPDFFNVDISKLKIGQNISVASLMSEDFTILHPESQVVVQVKTARTAVVADDEDEDGEEGAEGAEGASEEAAQE